MTDEEIIAEARIRYPIGTIVNSLGGCQGETITNLNTYYWEGRHFRINSDCSIYRKDTGQWATIVKLPEPVIINNYEIY